MAGSRPSAVPPAASLRNPTLYMIDYTSENSQGGSGLCDLPDELLLEIGKYCFDGFGLEYWSHKSGKPRATSTIIRAVEGFDTNGLKLLRLCKIIRRKLLPLLATMTDSTLAVFSFTDNYGHTGLGQDYSGRVVSQIKLQSSFCDSIKTLEFSSAARLIPDFQLFKNLISVMVHNSRTLWLTNYNAQLSDSDLSSLCRYGTGELEDDEAVKAGRRLCAYWTNHYHFAISWIHRLAAAIHESEAGRQVQLRVIHIIGRRSGWDAVMHHFESNNTHVLLSNKPWDWEWNHDFWKPPPTNLKKTKVLPTYV